MTPTTPRDRGWYASPPADFRSFWRNLPVSPQNGARMPGRIESSATGESCDGELNDRSMTKLGRGACALWIADGLLTNSFRNW
jgi:hypothetical protein